MKEPASEGAAPVPRLTHYALHCRDLDRTMAFYQELCGLELIHDRRDGDIRVVWLAAPGDADRLFFVLIDGGDPAPQRSDDIGHLGFELPTRQDVDRLHEAGRARGCVEWPARDDGYPVGYNCGLRDPDGKVVEFSYVLTYSDRPAEA